MAMATLGTQQKISKIRKPRVHITYDVIIDGTLVQKELPMVVGILSDVFGHNTNRIPFKERKFIKIEAGNFNQTMAKIAPELNFTISPKSNSGAAPAAAAAPAAPAAPGAPEATLAEKAAATIEVDLKFSTLDDFNPDYFIRQNKTLSPLFLKRRLLMDLIAKLDGNDRLMYTLIETIRAGKVKELILANAPQGGSSEKA